MFHILDFLSLLSYLNYDFHKNQRYPEKYLNYAMHMLKSQHCITNVYSEVHSSWFIYFHSTITSSQLQPLIQRFIFLRPQHFSYLNNLNWSWSKTSQSDWSWSFPGGSDGKETVCKIEDPLRFNPWVRKIPWRRTWQPTPVFLLGESHRQRTRLGYGPQSCREGNGTPLQSSCLESPMDGGAWWAAVHGVTKSWTWPSNFTFTFHFHALVRKWQPTPVFLPGESQGRGSLVGCHLWGHTELDTTEVT